MYTTSSYDKDVIDTAHLHSITHDSIWLPCIWLSTLWGFALLFDYVAYEIHDADKYSDSLTVIYKLQKLRTASDALVKC